MDKIYLYTYTIPKFEVFPLGYSKTSIEISKENNQAYYRRKFIGELTFINDEFTFFSDIELSANRCQKIYVEVERDGATFWVGYFVCSTGKFDYDRCAFSANPQPEDDYDKFIVGKDTAIDLTLLDEVTCTVDAAGYDDDFTHCHDWMVVVRELVYTIDPTLTVISTFFEDDTNPVTLKTNRHKGMCIAQKSDVKRPTATEQAAASMSWDEMSQILRVMFNVYYTIDGTNMYIEHLSYFQDASATIDLTGLNGEVAKRVFTYDSGNLPKSETVTLEAFNQDFIGYPITYDELCAPDEGEETVMDICCDLDMIVFDKADVADSGWVFFSVKQPTGATREVTIGKTPLEIETVVNNYMALTTLMYYYYRHGRVLKDGSLNTYGETFLSSKRLRIQELSVAECQDIDDNDEFVTSLSDVLDQNARIKTANMYPNRSTKFVLAYGDEAEVNPGITEKKYYIVSFEVSPNTTLKVYVELSEPAPVGGLTVSVGYKFDYAGGSVCEEYTKDVDFAAGDTTSGDSPITEVAAGAITINTLEVGATCLDLTWEISSLQQMYLISCP